MNRRPSLPPTTSASSTSTSGSDSESRASMSSWIALMSTSPHHQQKSGRAPAFVGHAAAKKLYGCYSTDGALRGRGGTAKAGARERALEVVRRLLPHAPG